MGDNAQLAVCFSFSMLYTNVFNWCDKYVWVGIFKTWGLQRRTHLEANQCVLQCISERFWPPSYTVLLNMTPWDHVWCFRPLTCEKCREYFHLYQDLDVSHFFPGSNSIFDGISGCICSILLQYHCSVTMLQLEAKQGRDFEALSVSQEWKGIGVWTPDSTRESLKIKSVELN